jgi:hypothetical protein
MGSVRRDDDDDDIGEWFAGTLFLDWSCRARAEPRALSNQRAIHAVSAR